MENEGAGAVADLARSINTNILRLSVGA